MAPNSTRSGSGCTTRTPFTTKYVPKPLDYYLPGFGIAESQANSRRTPLEYLYKSNLPFSYDLNLSWRTKTGKYAQRGPRPGPNTPAYEISFNSKKQVQEKFVEKEGAIAHDPKVWLENRPIKGMPKAEYMKPIPDPNPVQGQGPYDIGMGQHVEDAFLAADLAGDVSRRARKSHPQNQLEPGGIFASAFYPVGSKKATKQFFLGQKFHLDNETKEAVFEPMFSLSEGTIWVQDPAYSSRFVSSMVPAPYAESLRYQPPLTKQKNEKLKRNKSATTKRLRKCKLRTPLPSARPPPVEVAPKLPDTSKAGRIRKPTKKFADSEFYNVQKKPRTSAVPLKEKSAPSTSSKRKVAHEPSANVQQKQKTLEVPSAKKKRSLDPSESTDELSANVPKKQKTLEVPLNEKKQGSRNTPKAKTPANVASQSQTLATSTPSFPGWFAPSSNPTIGPIFNEATPSRPDFLDQYKPGNLAYFGLVQDSYANDNTPTPPNKFPRSRGPKDDDDIPSWPWICWTILAKTPNNVSLPLEVIRGTAYEWITAVPRKDQTVRSALTGPSNGTGSFIRGSDKRWRLRNTDEEIVKKPGGAKSKAVEATSESLDSSKSPKSRATKKASKCPQSSSPTKSESDAPDKPDKPDEPYDEDTKMSEVPENASVPENTELAEDAEMS
ncbi:hypothetical protein BKA65DRAFT_473814 [Rhexocercosporidium sp. MPI-PUGE-AT-0058]|nr:hypothetical protein BKA65DRAFT_473814 [Rhexocercosporidium sp. MPI-PUGE-AT-0058]